ncbi:GNAT family N-acetyltransferase [Paenibacillus sp. GCM10023252]|uniref:GNAT family N-acetyltransferase n=1 Tax=Paenibacillus sp. GCM10023252 TaxID=3252649 RepID=UPI00361EAFE0
MTVTDQNDQGDMFGQGVQALQIRPLQYEEIDQAISLELASYPAEAAASREAFLYRLEHYPEWFWSAWSGEQLVGILNGVLTSEPHLGDELKSAHEGAIQGNHLCILTVAVDPRKRREGIGSKLLQHVLDKSQYSALQSIVLMCEEELIPFYERAGFSLIGPSASQHGGLLWYEMSRPVHTMEHLTE